MKSTKKNSILSSLAALALVTVAAPHAEAAGTTPDTHAATVQLWIKKHNTACSGVFVAPSLILTAKHCVADGSVEQNIPVYKSHAGQGEPIATAEVVWSHEGSTRNNPDLALLRTSNYSTWDYAPISRSEPRQGERLQICGVGNRNDMWGSAGYSYCGDTSMTRMETYPTDYILSKPLVTANRDSGGPAYNSKGYVVGITHGDDWESNYSTPLQDGTVLYWLSLYGADVRF
ncbi:MAG: trypsin-like peptidase domain-containing protein [Neisseriaceae bacterium]|nr:trypsin-like peptidase domain-containing protein [Neisseriaceae bacterium]